jgi:GT2 family glycosyltransferase
MIVTCVPYRPDANLGRAYNDFMDLLGLDDWAVFLDHDATPTTGKWFAQIAEAIAFRPDAGAFVAMSNRIASSWQRCGDPSSNDIAAHRRFGAERAKVRSLLDVTETKGFGGVMFAVPRRLWAAIGTFADGLGCVDHSWHFACQRAGRRVYLIEGLYVYHWRHYGEPDPTSLHPKAVACPCRGVEKQPAERIALPC